MKLSFNGLKQLLEKNVVELKFVKKNTVASRPVSRRMLASLNPNILDTNLGKTIFNFKRPTQAPAYNALSYELITVYDLFMQDWRNIPFNNVEVVRVLNCTPPEEFWKYFDEVLSKMTAAQKATFMQT